MTKDAHMAAALAYHRHGWAIIPAAPRSKRPIVRWQIYQDGMPGEKAVRKWFARWPDANLSVVTGANSGIVVLDVDPAHGGASSLSKMEDRHGALPETVESRTGGGGRHIYFAHPGFEVRNRAGLAPGLDLRGDGGVIIVPPSIHPNGKPYMWCQGHAPDEIALAPLPVWLTVPRFDSSDNLGHSLDYWRTLVAEGVEEGRRNTTIASFTGHLLWHHVDPDVVMELMLSWNRTQCRPPLDDAEVIRTVRSVERTHADAEPTQT